MFLVPSLGRGGAEAQVVDLVNGLDYEHFSPTLVSFESEFDRLPNLDQDKVDFVHLPRHRRFDLTLAFRIAEVVRDRCIELIHCTLQVALLLGLAAARLSNRGPGVIGAVHTTVPRHRKNALLDRYLYCSLMGRADAALFVCEEQLKYWRRVNGYRFDNAVVVHNGIDTGLFSLHSGDWKGGLRQQLKIPESSQVFCCIAAFRPEKGHRILLDAFEMASSQFGDVHLLLAGDGIERYAVEMVAAEKPALRGRVHFLGSLADVRPVIEASDCLVIPSTAVETFSISMLESMSMERPVIATDIGGAREAVITGETGILVKPGSAVSLSDAMKEMLLSPGLAKRMGETARRIVLERFDRGKMIRNIEQIMHNVVNQSRLKAKERHRNIPGDNAVRW